MIFFPQMRDAEQLDLFRHSAGATERACSGGATRPVIAYDTLDDDSLVAALANAGIRDCAALAAEAAHRRLAAAIPVLEVMCLRLTGFGADRIVPEQAAAIEGHFTATTNGREASTLIAELEEMTEEEAERQLAALHQATERHPRRLAFGHGA